MAHIEWFGARPLPRQVAGGKGASLSDLIEAGFSVPPGFCVTAEAYRYFLDVTGLDARIDVILRNADLALPHSAAEAGREISALILATALPDDLQEEIARAYQDLAARLGPACAVRSSAIAEDGAASSFAGLYETYLNIVGADEVVDRVRRCYASLWSERAVRYRANRTDGSEDEAMAVVVMALVRSDVSGIAFTAHPVTGSREQVVINASWGLGEAVVSGLVTPDSFVVEKESLTILERDIFLKELALAPQPDGGTIETALEPGRASAACLTDDQIREIARMASRIEQHYGAPQDIEWGIQDGQLFLLQSRPITTL